MSNEKKKPILSNIDLNLLRTFRVLYQERNTRKTAERNNVTQSAISQNLQKLRRLFDDELFVKVHKGLAPTPFADQLESAIALHLNGLERAISELYEFTPRELTGSLKVALSHVVMPSIAGALYQEFRRHAPQLQLELVSWNHSTPQLLLSGEVFYGVHYDLDTLSKEIARGLLNEIEGKVIVRQEHPHKASCITMDEATNYAIASHIAPGWNDGFVFAQQLAAMEGYELDVGFRSEDLLALIDIVETSDMLLPQSSLFPINKFPQLRVLAISLQSGHKHFNLYGYVHSKNRNSSLAKWVESLIQQEIAKALNKHH